MVALKTNSLIQTHTKCMPKIPRQFYNVVDV